MEVPTSLSTTKVDIHPFEMKWEIENYSIFRRFHRDGDNDNALLSKVYEFGYQGQKWQMVFDHNGEGGAYISIFLHFIQDDKTLGKYPRILAKFSLYSKLGVKYLAGCRCFVKQYQDPIERCGFASFMKVSDLTGEIGQEYGLLEDDTIRIHCRIDVDGSQNNMKEDYFWSVKRKLDQWSFDFGNLYQAGSLADLILIAANGKEFPTHKAVLAARSPVFCKMLTTPMVESQEHKIEIQMGESIVKGLLGYIYTGSTECLENNKDVAQYFKIGDMYEIPELKKVAVLKLMEGITDNNFVERLTIAYLHDIEVMNTELSKYFFANREAILASEEYVELQKLNPAAIENLLLYQEITNGNFTERMRTAYLQDDGRLKSKLANYFEAHKQEIKATEEFTKLCESDPDVIVAVFLN